MRVVLVVTVIGVAGAGGYGYLDLSRKLNETQGRLAEAEAVIAKDRQTLGLVCNEYASAPKVDRALDHLQGQINGLGGEVGHIKGDYAAAPKVEARLAGIEHQLKAQSAGVDAN